MQITLFFFITIYIFLLIDSISQEIKFCNFLLLMRMKKNFLSILGILKLILRS